MSCEDVDLRRPETVSLEEEPVCVRSLWSHSAWRIQFACAVVWWVTAVATCFASDTQSTIVFLGAIFLCQIVFGVYGMIADVQERKRRSLIHA